MKKSASIYLPEIIIIIIIITWSTGLFFCGADIGVIFLYASLLVLFRLEFSRWDGVLSNT